GICSCHRKKVSLICPICHGSFSSVCWHLTSIRHRAQGYSPRNQYVVAMPSYRASIGPPLVCYHELSMLLASHQHSSSLLDLLLPPGEIPLHFGNLVYWR